LKKANNFRGLLFYAAPGTAAVIVTDSQVSNKHIKHFRAATLGKLFTHTRVCLCHRSV